MPLRYFPNSKPEPHILEQAMSFLSVLHPISAGLRERFKEKTFCVTMQKDSHLIREGEISAYVYFLISGIVTGYRLRGSERLTTFISVPGDVISAIQGIYGGVPSKDNMITATDCYFVALRAVDLLDMYEHYPEMNIIVRKILESYYLIAHERAVVIRMGSAKEKYAYYQKNLTSPTDAVPIDIIASFLDLKTATLEKIIRDEAKTKIEPETEVIARLEQIMTSEKVFQQKRLTLKALAAAMHISAHELSSLLNSHYQQRFSDFINTFRIEYVKDQLKSVVPLQQLTIEALGDEAGFSSKSTFFSAFKKHTNMSPLEFARETA